MISFKINDAVIKQVKRTVSVHGTTYVLGCGNIYTDKDSAYNKKEYTNPDQEEATFLLKFDNIKDVPNTVEEFENAFFESRKNEIKHIKDASIKANKNIIDMRDYEETKEVKKNEIKKEVETKEIKK